MTVRQLITALSRVKEKDMEVYVTDSSTYANRVSGAKIEHDMIDDVAVLILDVEGEWYE